MQHKEKYTLTWHNYSDHLLKALEEMMTSSAFADVTLVTDDKQQIRAHQNILSACSPVFKKILQLDSGVNTNPIIYLRGIQHAEMESIMQFIYFGETRFYKERMSEILMVAKNLEIQELSTAEMNNEMVSNEESNVNESSVVLNEDQCENMDIAGVPPHAFDEKTEIVERYNATKGSEINKQFSNKSKFQCKQCDKSYSGSGALSNHNKSVHEGVKYDCDQCDFQSRRQDSLTIHIKSIHEGIKYACDQCDYQSGYQSDLTKHMQSKHEGIRYACDQCDFRATSQNTLTKHIKRKHL